MQKCFRLSRSAFLTTPNTLNLTSLSRSQQKLNQSLSHRSLIVDALNLHSLTYLSQSLDRSTSLTAALHRSSLVSLSQPKHKKRFPVEKRIGRLTFGGDGELNPLLSARFLLPSTKIKLRFQKVGFFCLAGFRVSIVYGRLPLILCPL